VRKGILTTAKLSAGFMSFALLRASIMSIMHVNQGSKVLKTSCSIWSHWAINWPPADGRSNSLCNCYLYTHCTWPHGARSGPPRRTTGKMAKLYRGCLLCCLFAKKGKLPFFSWLQYLRLTTACFGISHRWLASMHDWAIAPFSTR
jgi:hypothetical protein